MTFRKLFIVPTSDLDRLAGVALYGTTAQVTPEEIRRVIEVNLLGEMYGTKPAFTPMRPTVD